MTTTDERIERHLDKLDRHVDRQDRFDQLRLQASREFDEVLFALFNRHDRTNKEALRPDQLAAETIRASIELWVRSLVSKPDAIDVALVSTSDTHLIEITCHPDDAPKLVGKGGRVIEALKALAGALAGKHSVRCRVELLV
ncbi:KH domain-containing protein [Persicimonas caeni]|uniref:RNA-binding protein KhpA n=1 Tax=Persicimonas caeni TaxID=2292766 RepID=A0A4Y6PLT8_PERCE|nr:KH domain-containing protein [Persicimonas caeni]QDG49276.1 KH domain-containing protein [Persicimonas caeni]QED30497.1 KH domain-containing protein [Persicimonas caeni]